MNIFIRIAVVSSFSFLFALTGCNSKKASPVVPVEPISQASAIPTGPCPAGIGASAGDQAQVTVAVENGQLLVCGYEHETSVEPGRKHLSEFDIYSLIEGNLSKPIFTAGAVNEYQVYAGTNELILEELMFYRGTLKPAFRFSIACKLGTCGRSTEKCILPGTLGGAEASAALAKVKTKAPLEENDIEVIFDAALEGSKPAGEFFSKELPKGVTIDGAVAEAYFSNRVLLKRLAKCPKAKN